MLFKHNLFYFLMKGSSGLLGLISVFVFTRMLSPEEYGIYATMISFIGVISAVFYQWLSLGVGRFYDSEQKNIGNLISTSLFGFLLSTFLLISIFIGFSIFFSDYKLAYWGIFFIPLVLSFGWFDLNLRIANASFAVVVYGKLSFSRSLLALVLGVFGYSFYDVKGIFVGMILSALLVPFIWMRSIWSFFDYNLVDKTLIKRLLVYGIPLAVSITLTLVVDVSDRFLIQFFLGKEQAGLYSASYDLVMQTLGFSLAIIYLAFFPHVVNAAKLENNDALKMSFRRYGSAMIMVSVPLLSIFICISASVCDLILGLNYRSSGINLIPIISIAIFIGSLKNYFIDLPFQLKHKTMLQIWPSLLAAVSNLALNFYLIPSYGIVGAAYSTGLAFTLGAILSAIIGRKVMALTISIEDIIKILICGVLISIWLLMFPRSNAWGFLIFEISTAIFIYVALILILNVNEARGFFIRNFLGAHD